MEITTLSEAQKDVEGHRHLRDQQVEGEKETDIDRAEDAEPGTILAFGRS